MGRQSLEGACKRGHRGFLLYGDDAMLAKDGRVGGGGAQRPVMVGRADPRDTWSPVDRLLTALWLCLGLGRHPWDGGGTGTRGVLGGLL